MPVPDQQPESESDTDNAAEWGELGAAATRLAAAMAEFGDAVSEMDAAFGAAQDSSDRPAAGAPQRAPDATAVEPSAAADD